MLGTKDDEFLVECGLLLLWSEGYVEPVEPPLLPLHLRGDATDADVRRAQRRAQARFGNDLAGVTTTADERALRSLKS